MRGLDECAAKRRVSSDAATTAVGEVARNGGCELPLVDMMARRAKNKRHRDLCGDSLLRPCAARRGVELLELSRTRQA